MADSTEGSGSEQQQQQQQQQPKRNRMVDSVGEKAQEVL
jgi:hypothetical protein